MKRVIKAATNIPNTIDEWVDFFETNIPDFDDAENLRDDLEHNRYIGHWVDMLYLNKIDDEVMDALEAQFDDSGDDEDYTFMGKKYRAACDTGKGWETKVSNNPLDVLEFWFKWSKLFPMEVAIDTRTRADGVALLKIAKKYLDELYNKYDCPYKYDYLKDAIDKGIATGCRDIIEGEFGDQIHPFSYG